MGKKKEGKVMSVDEVAEICLQDRDFYEESRGGVTLSGGEGMMYPNFAIALADCLHLEGIHIAIETSGYIKQSIFEKVSSHLDLLLFDVKHYDREYHYEGTGIYNDLIIDNLKRTISKKRNTLPRIPVIPEFNSNLKDAYGFTNLFKKIGVKRVQLLPFHQFGKKKYELLNMTYKLSNYKALQPEDLEEYKQVFCNNGINCFF
jgi:pyruvate formate lyase activating enzyme